jgi:hypothetical protein
MGKTLKTVGMVLGAAAMIATGVGALAMPGLAGSVTLFGVSTGTLNLASAGLTAVGGLLDKPQSAGSGSPSDWTSNPDQPTPFAFGRVGVAGKIIHRDEFGKDNKLQGIVSIFSGAGPIKGFVSYKADDLAVSFESNGGTAIGKYRRQMWRSWRLGAQPDTALSLPTGLDEGAVMPAWDYRYKLSGKACDLLTVQQDSKFSVYPSGVPTPMVELDGVFGYDPRYDSTYPGGAGPCRLGVRSTYIWIDNPIIAGLNWALGMVENGQVVGGIGASIHGIDVPAFVEAANVADANDWKVTAWPDTSEDASQVLRQFLQAGGASYARHAGKISCVTRGAARPSIVTITARDTCGPLELDTGSSSFNRLNTITPEFMSAAHGWQHVPTDPVTFASLRAEDGGKKADRIRYRFAPSAKQAGQLAAYDILDAREPFSGTIPLKPHLRRLKRGDCFTLSEPGFLLDGVKFIVLGRTYDAQKGEVRLAFRSETDGKHDLALGKTATMPEYPGLTPADPTVVSPPNPDDWVITPRPPGPGGTLVPGFDLSGVVGNSTATAIEVQWWEVPDGTDHMELPPEDAVWQSAGTWPPTATGISINVPGGRYYWIGLIHIRNLNYSERTPYGPYLAGVLVADLAPDAPALEDIRAEARAKAALLIKEAVDRWNRDEKEKKFAIQNVEYVNEKLAITRETLELADADQLALLEVERVARIDADEAESTARQLQIAGVEDALSVVDEFSRATATALGAETETRTTQVSSLGEALAIVDTRATTAVTTANAAAEATSVLVAEVEGVQSTVTMNSEAIVDLESQNNVARFDLEAAAGGGRPARVSIISQASGSDIALMADQLWFGDNTFWEDASDTLQTLTGDGRRLVTNGPFGASGEMLMWLGPAGVAVADMTRANADFYLARNAPRIGGNDFPSGGGGLGAVAVPDIASGSAPGGGAVSTGTVEIVVSGPGASSATVRWVKTDEVGGNVDVFQTGRFASFSGNVAPGGLTRAIYLAIVSFGGQTATVVVDVQLTDSN